MSVWSIVVAAGSGTRFGGPKQLAPLAGGRVLDWSISTAASVADGVVVVVPKELASEAWEPADGRRLTKTAITVVAGGSTRSASVRAGLAVVPNDAQVIVVHDGARPLAEPALFGRVIAAVRDGAAAAVTVVPVTDTIREVGASTVDRSALRAVQTPQAFWADSLRKAHAAEDDATDDASLVEAQGGRVVLVDGAPGNIKITTPVDLVIAAAIMNHRASDTAPTDGQSADETSGSIESKEDDGHA